jgi:hypothetical protein
MALKFSSYAVFLEFHQTINNGGEKEIVEKTHVAHFPTLEAAINFSNDIKALSKFNASEPIPLVATEEVKV